MRYIHWLSTALIAVILAACGDGGWRTDVSGSTGPLTDMYDISPPPDIAGGTAVLPQTRFTDNGNGTVTDNLTLRVWLKNANCFGALTKDAATGGASELASGACGLSDGSAVGQWRLPSSGELTDLFAFGVSTTTGILTQPGGHPFSDVQSFYWTSDLSGVFTTGIEPGSGGSGNPHLWPILRTLAVPNPYWGGCNYFLGQIVMHNTSTAIPIYAYPDTYNPFAPVISSMEYEERATILDFFYVGNGELWLKIRKNDGQDTGVTGFVNAGAGPAPNTWN